MKKISRTVAMILVLVMIASSFTGCMAFLPILGYGLTGSGDAAWNGFRYGTGIDMLVLLGLGALWILMVVEALDEMGTGIYLAHAEFNPLTEYNAIIEKLNSLPEAERNSFLGKFYSLPEEKRASLVDIIASLPESEIASSCERVNALSDEEFASLARAFSSLSDTELDLLMDRLRERAAPMPEIKSVAVSDYHPIYAYQALRY